MVNSYLKGFKLGFQPSRHTAEQVYREIIKRKPDFLDKQVSNNLSPIQKQHLGQFEGEFLTNEVEIHGEQISFSNLAKELLFSDAPALEHVDITKENVQIESTNLTDESKSSVSQIDSKSQTHQHEEELSSW